MRTDYFFSFQPLQQVPDSTQTGESFMQLNNQGFMGQQSIMSAEFDDNSVDSLVKVKTRRLRPRKKKLHQKSYKYLDSYLIVKKDSFPFLENIKANSFSTINFDKFISNNDTSCLVYNKPNIFFNQDNINIDSISADCLSVDSINSITPKSFVADTSTIGYELTYFTVIPNGGSTPTEQKLTTELPDIQDIPVQNENANTYNLSSQIWLMLVILSVLLLYAFTKMHFKSKLKGYTQAVISYQSFNKMFKEQNMVNLRLGFLLSLIYNVSISLIIYYSVVNYFILNNYHHGIILFLIILGLVIAFTLFVISINKLLAFFFEQSNLINEIVYNFLFTNRIFGLLLLPIALTYPYLPEFFAKILLFSTWGIIVFSFVFRWFRGLVISFKYRVSYLYMILYLCILEIIPLIFFVKEILSLY